MGLENGETLTKELGALMGSMGETGKEQPQPQEMKPDAVKDPVKPKEPEKAPAQEPEKDSEGDPTEKKLERIQQKTQERIDELTRDKKSLQMQMEKLHSELEGLKSSPREQPQDPGSEIETEGVKILSELQEIEKKMNEAQIEEDDSEWKKLHTSKVRLQMKLMRLEDQWNKAQEDVQTTEQKKVQAERVKTWEEGLMEAVDEFPELYKDSEGKLNVESPAFKKALELFMENAATPRYATWANGGINPKYDHPQGAYICLLKAAQSFLKNKGPEVNKDAEKLKRKVNEMGAKMQGFDSSGVQGVSGEPDFYDNLEALSQSEGGMNNPKSLKLLRSIQPKEKR